MKLRDAKPANITPETMREGWRLCQERLRPPPRVMSPREYAALQAAEWLYQQYCATRQGKP